MDINHMQRAAQRSYHVNADRIKQQMQQMDKGSAADYRMCDRAEISEEGRNAIKEKWLRWGNGNGLRISKNWQPYIPGPMVS